jgi:ParB-like chromosome segregation protein Spo0J
MTEIAIERIAETPEVKSMPVELIDPFPKHSFEARDDVEMDSLIQSASEYGVLTPAIMRSKEAQIL